VSHLGTRSARPFAFAAASALLAAAPRAAEACAVCAPGQGGQGNFLLGTVLLSTLPLAMVGGLVWYLRRRARAQEREQAARVAPAAALGPSASPR
jgi:hypothetical protein